jgi:hypothetical protein
MKKPFLLFALKCSVIVYFAACTSIEKLAISKSVTDQLVSKTAWKVNCFGTATNDNTCIFEGYAFSFDASGKVLANKDGKTIEGHWLENTISKTVTISFDNANPVLNELSNYWNISSITDTGISFEKMDNKDNEKFYISAL